MKIGYLMQAGVPDVRRPPFSGAANHVKHVFLELQKLGHDLRMVACLDGKIWTTVDLENFTPVARTGLDRGFGKLFESSVRKAQSILRLPYLNLFESLRFALVCCKQFQGFDLLYERMGWTGYGGVMASRWLGIPHVFEVNGDLLWEHESVGLVSKGIQRWAAVKNTGLAVRRSTHSVATGKGWKKRHIERWGISEEKVSVLENGSEIVNLLPRSRIKAFRPSEWEAGKILAVYVGGFEPWHGLDKLLKAASRVIAGGVPLSISFAGSGSEETELKKLADELGLAGSVSFVGQLGPKQLADFLSEADLAVSPYCGRVEYSGLKLLDYKSAGLATIASGTDGEPAVIDHGKTGLIVTPCDEVALSEALRFLATDYEMRQSMGRAARIEAEQLHGWQVTASELSSLLERLVA